MVEESVIIKNKDELRELFGHLDTKIKLISQTLSVNISTRNSNTLSISGEKNNVHKAAKIIEDLLVIIRGGYSVDLSEVRYQIDMFKENNTFHLDELYKEEVDLLSGENPDFRKLCAGGFRDTTRVASGSPELWTAILSQNRTEAERGLGKLITILEKFQSAVASGDTAALTSLLTQARTAREAITQGT